MTDIILQLGDSSTLVRMKDSGDGTVARVIAAGSSSASSAGDKLVDAGDGITKKRLRDMGDGSFAEVFYGA